MASARASTTPNPNAMKFTLDVTLAERIDTVRGVGDDTPFARAVLALDGVVAVFGVNDFVTVTRDPGADWDPIVCAVEEAAAEHLAHESVGESGVDEVARARRLLRDAADPPKPSTVEIRTGRQNEPGPDQ